MRPSTMVTGLSVLLAMGTADSSARAANWTVPSIYSNWSWAPSSTGYPSFTQRLIVTRDPGPSVMRFWAAQFFTSAPGGNGGYVGIQDGAARTDGATGKIAIFSFWGASGATPGPGARCQTFGGEGTGYSCHLDDAWAPGHPYLFSVAAVGAGEWRGSIQDEATGVTSVIGTIRVPAAWGQLTNWVHDFTEDFGENSGYGYASCGAVPSGAAVWFAPSMAGAGAVASVADPVGQGASCNNVTATTSADRTYAIQAINTGAPPSPRPLPAKCGDVGESHGLVVGTGMTSCDGRFQLHMQADGDLVLFRGSTRMWESGTHTALMAVMQDDGNFVLYDDAGRAAWTSNTSHHPGSHLALQDDGNLVVYGPGAAPLWASNTH
jgi:hypothetical protein